MSAPMETDDPISQGGPAAPAADDPALNAERLVESMKLEHQLLRVPFEHYKKMIRANHRTVEKEFSAVILGVTSAVESALSRDEAFSQLNSFVARLQDLKRKLEAGSQTEHVQAQRCRIRLAHLESSEYDVSTWNSIRIKRILVDYFLRMSYYDTAAKLAERSNIEDLVDIDVFQEARKVIDSLQRKEVVPALAWCAENKSRLKKSKSTFEFQLRQQEFIGLVSENDMRLAIAYCRKYLAPWATSHMKELQRVVAILAFKGNTTCARYKVLFEEKQWDLLVEHFKQEFYRVHGMICVPLLNVYLQSGLCALKSVQCYTETCPREDPLSNKTFRDLANPLPFSKQNHSRLICYISKEVMDHHNPPLVLPNGYVYGTKALTEMSKQNNGTITCPRTGSVYNYTELTRAYVS